MEISKLSNSEKKQHRTLLEKYANLEKKLDSGFSSEMEEVMTGRGHEITVNPMLYRPYSLLRYVILKGFELCRGPRFKFLDLIDGGVVKCGVDYGLSKTDYSHQHLKAGLKVIFRHIKYGPSELDGVYCLDDWARYFKRYGYNTVYSSYVDKEVEELLENNLELDKYFKSTHHFKDPNIINEENPKKIFNKVSKNLAESTFNIINAKNLAGSISDIINTQKIVEFNRNSELYGMLCYLNAGDLVEGSISYALYAKLFEFIRWNRFDTFSDFIEQGVPQFFGTKLSSHNAISSEILEKHEREFQRRVEEKRKRKQILEERGREQESVPTPMSNQNEGVLKPTSMFESSESESTIPKDIPKRPVRTDVLEEGKSLENQLQLKLKRAEELNSEIGALQNKMQKLPTEMEKLQTEKEKLQTQMEKLQDKISYLEYTSQINKSTLEALIKREETLWDDIEELQRKLK